MERLDRFMEWFGYFIHGILFKGTLSLNINKHSRTLREAKIFPIVSDYNLYSSKREPKEVGPIDVKYGKLLSSSQKSADFKSTLFALDGAETVFYEEEVVEIFVQHRKFFDEHPWVYFLFWYDFGDGLGVYIGCVNQGQFAFWKPDRHQVFEGYVLF